MTVENPGTTEGRNEGSKRAERHPIYWDENGTMIVQVQQTLFKTSADILCRHSPVVLKGIGSNTRNDDIAYIMTHEAQGPGYVIDGKQRQPIRTIEEVQSKDFGVLLETLVDEPETWSFDRVVALMRVCGPQQLDVGGIYANARGRFEAALPDEPLALMPDTHPLYQGLEVAERYGFPKIRNAILYTLVTTHHFVEDDEGTETEAEPVGGDDLSPLTPNDRALCTHIMHTLIAHFTPTLYTVASAGHMACTDALAEHWMTLVILPSLSDDGVYKPIETLERIKGIKWEDYGLCKECCEDKRKEWTEEQNVVWGRLGEWIVEAEKAAAEKVSVV